MTHKLPPNLLALFAARPALRYLPHADHAAEERKTNNIGGVAHFLTQVHDYEDIPYKPTESWLERKDRIKLEKKARQENLVLEGEVTGVIRKDKKDDPNIRGDAFKTLFVARLSYDTTEKDLEREFGRFGPIERIRIVTNTQEEQQSDSASKSKKKKKKNHRGYAFIVYEREKDMKAAYKETEGIRIKDRRVLVDVERGRTVKGWLPRRLGGGLGGRGYTRGAPARPFGFAAPAGPGAYPGGFRGGFGGRPERGGFRGGSGGFRDRGGFGGGPRGGGIGYQGGGFSGGPRGGYGSGGGPNGYGPPSNAPAGPGGRGGYGGGFGGSPNGVNGGMNGGPPYGDDPRRSGSGGYGDRPPRSGGYGGGGGGGGVTGSNNEPIGSRPPRGYEDRDRHGGRPRDDDYGSRKRYHDGDAYDDSRSKRRY